MCNDIDNDLLNKCIITYLNCRIQMKIAGSLYDKNYKIVRKLQEKLDEYRTSKISNFQEQKTQKLSIISTIINKCIFYNKYQTQYKALKKKEYELASIKPPASNAALYYSTCHYEPGRYHPIESNIPNFTRGDSCIVVFPKMGDVIITLVPIELTMIWNFLNTKLKNIFIAEKLGLLSIHNSYTIDVHTENQFSKVPKIYNGFSEETDDNKNYVCVRANENDPYQDGTHGIVLTFSCVFNMYVDDILIASNSCDIEYTLGNDIDVDQGKGHGYWVVDGNLGYYRINPNYIGNVVMNKINKSMCFNVVNHSHVDKMIEKLQEFINDERKIIHEKYKTCEYTDELKNLKLKTNIDTSESSIYSNNLSEMQRNIQCQTLNEEDYTYNVNILSI